MKKNFFSLLAVVLTSMCVLSGLASCNKDDDNKAIEPTPEKVTSVEYQANVTTASSKLLASFINFINNKADGSAKVSPILGYNIRVDVYDQTKFNALLNSLKANSSELDAAMQTADPDATIQVTISYGDKVSFNYGWAKKTEDTFAKYAGTYKYTSEDGKVWSFVITTETYKTDTTEKKGTFTVPEGYELAAKTYEGRWMTIGDVIGFFSNDVNSKGNDLFNTYTDLTKSDGNSLIVTLEYNNIILENVKFIKQ